MRVCKGALAGAVSLSLVVAFAPAARADWTVFRGDARRSGASSSRAQLVRPAVAWNQYLGGGVGQAIAVDADGDGSGDVLYVSAGRMIAKRYDDSVLWQTPVLDLRSLQAVVDLDRDGVPEVLATGAPGLLAVLRLRDGAVLWRSAPGQFGAAVGAVRVADFDADGAPEVYAADAACGNAGSERGYLFSFARGFGSGVADATTTRWSLSGRREYACGVHDVLVDLDGDRVPEVLSFGSAYAYVYEGSSGRTRASGAAEEPARDGYALGFSLPFGSLFASVTDVDGDGDEEVVGFTNNAFAPSINSRAVFVLDWDRTRPQAQRLFVRWRSAVASVIDDRHEFTQDGVVDLDGDGLPEVVSSFVTGGTSSVTTVYRGSDGSPLARLPDTLVAGVLGGPTPTLMVRRADALEGYRFARFGGPLPAPLFRLSGEQPAFFTDLTRPRRSDLGPTVITLPGAPPGTEFFTRDAAGSRVTRWTVAPGTGAASPGEQRTINGSTVTLLAPQRDVAVPGPGLLLVRSDGVLEVLDQALRPRNLSDGGMALTGVRIGGFYSGGCGFGAPLLAARSEGPTGPGAVVVSSVSSGGLEVLDPSGASNVAPPRVRWAWPGAEAPLLLEDSSARSWLVVATERRPGAASGEMPVVRARRALDGSEVWAVTPPLAPNEVLTGDALPLRQGGAPTSIVLGVRNGGTGEGLMYALELPNPASPRPPTLRYRTPSVYVAGSTQGIAVAYPLDGDGDDDVLAVLAGPTRAFDGATGRMRGSSAVTLGWFPLSLGEGEVALVAGADDPTGFALNPGAVPGGDVAFERRWSVALDGVRSSYCAPAVVTCPDGPRFAGALASRPVVYVARGRSGSMVYRARLTDGRTQPDDPGITSGGLLGNVSAIADLGDGRPAFLVGSSDGRLYALDACSNELQLRWALDLGAPVGEAVLADVDADGFDEVLVTTADGFLRAIDLSRIDAPTWVYDTDPPAGFPDVDVDEVHGEGLFARWPVVPGASSYEWAVFTVLGEPVSGRRGGTPDDAFVPVNAAAGDAFINVAFPSEGRLVSGSRYVVAVRALGTDATGVIRSTEAVSDGVRWIPTVRPSPDGGTRCVGRVQDCYPELRLEGRAGPGCACAVPGARAPRIGVPSGLLMAAIAVASWVRRRRRR